MDPCIGKDLHQSTNVVNRYAHDLLHLEFLAHKSMASVYSPRSTSTPAQRRTTTQPGMISWSQMTGLAFPSHLPILQGPTNVQRECQVQFFKEEIFLQ